MCAKLESVADFSSVHTLAILSAVSLQNGVGLSKCWMRCGRRHRIFKGKPVYRAQEDREQSAKISKASHYNNIGSDNYPLINNVPIFVDTDWPAICEGSMSVCFETVMSLLRRWMVSSWVEADVKPLRKSCSRPGKLYHFSFARTFSRCSLLSTRSRGNCPSSLLRSRRANRYSNS